MLGQKREQYKNLFYGTVSDGEIEFIQNLVIFYVRRVEKKLVASPKIDSPKIEILSICDILKKNPQLNSATSNLIQLRPFSHSLKVGSLKKAVMLLGLKRFEQMAFSAYMEKSMDL